MYSQTGFENINTKKLIRIKMNILDLLISICLTRKYNNKDYQIAYLSKKLSLAKQNYNIHNK